MLTFIARVNGVLTDVDSVKFNNPSAQFGLRRVSTGEIIVPAATAWVNVGLGTYQFDEAALGLLPEVGYEYWVEVEFDGEFTGTQRFITGAGLAELVQRTIRFVCVENDAFVSLVALPLLSSPTDTFGVARMDTGVTVLTNNTAMIAGGTLYSASFGEPESGLKYRYYVEVVHNDITYYVPRTTQYMNSASLLLGRYTDSVKIEQQFGFDNIHKWVALDDGDEAVDYAMREYKFIVDAEQQVDEAVAGYHIREVFTATEEAPVPKIITQVSTILAGCLMYEARGATDLNQITGEILHKYSAMRRNAEKLLKGIKSGRVSLPSTMPCSLPQYGHKIPILGTIHVPEPLARYVDWLGWD